MKTSLFKIAQYVGLVFLTVISVLIISCIIMAFVLVFSILVEGLTTVNLVKDYLIPFIGAK